MKIELTANQYKNMLQAFYLGDLVLHSMKEEEEDQNPEFIQTEQYILSLSKEFGFEDYVEYDKELNMYFPTRLMEEEFDQHMRDYEQEILPDQIAATIARNEVEKQIAENQIQKEEALQLLLELEDDYLTQIDEKGLSGLHFK